MPFFIIIITCIKESARSAAGFAILRTIIKNLRYIARTAINCSVTRESGITLNPEFFKLYSAIFHQIPDLTLFLGKPRIGCLEFNKNYAILIELDAVDRRS